MGGLTQPSSIGWGARLAVVLALGEPLLLGILFDAGNLVGRGSAGLVLSSAGYVLMLLAGVAAALFVLAFLRPTEVALVAEELRRHRTTFLPWSVHALAFGALFAVTGAVFGRTGSLTPAPPGTAAPLDWSLLVAWLLAAFADFVSLARCVLPFAAWLRLARRLAKTLSLGVAAGTTAWVLGIASDQAWTPLSKVTLALVARLLERVEREVVLVPSEDLIGTPRFAVSIAPVCSGFEGMGLVCVFLGLLLVAGRRVLRIGRVAMLLPLAVVFVWASNAARIAVLILIGTHVSPEVALGGFHSKAGWFFFCLIALAIVALVRRVPFFLREAPAKDDGTYNPTVVYLTPVAALLGTAMLTGMFTLHVDYAYGLRVVAVALALYATRRLLPRPALGLHWTAFAFGVLGYVAWIALAPSVDPTGVAAARAELEGLGTAWFVAWVALRIVGSVLFVPVAEELAFRGFLLPRLIDADFLGVPARRLTALALVISSAAFGLLHERWWLGGSVCGVLYALARQRRGRLSDAVTAHATTNLLVALDVVVRQSWHLWL
ncbi:MAG: exosortase E/protease, VPEID-CTERM system [Polyangiaceae bacterium]|nr:exosortase E/protease, VPEID-CTERM system [Polyangiaceae bacterium]